MRVLPYLFVAFAFVCLTSDYAWATEPIGSVVRRSKRYVVELRPTSDDAVVVRRAETSGATKISLDSFVARTFTVQQLTYTTAGIWWYKNSLSFFDPSGEMLVIRLGHGKFIGVNLKDGRPVSKLPEALEAASKRRAIEMSLNLLKSKKSFDRQTGAIVCGQEKVREAIPRLKQLLKDGEYYTTNLPKEGTRVYYVRKEARAALQLMHAK